MVSVDIGGMGEMLYNLFYYAVIFLAIFFVIGVLWIGAYYYLQATRYDVEAYIKRRGVPKYMKDKIRYLKTETGETAYLIKAKKFLHPEKIRPFIKFVEGKKKPIIYLYTEDGREFYPMDEDVYKIEKEMEIEEGGKKKKVKIEGRSLACVIPINDQMVRQFGYEELKVAKERGKIENPFTKLVEFGKYALIGIFLILGIMIIANSMKDFSAKMVEISKENIQAAKGIIAKTEYVYNATQQLMETQKEYVREMRRMTDNINDLVSQIREEQKEFREWVQQNKYTGGGTQYVNASTG